MVTYESDGKYAYFNGLKFTRDDDTGYYLNSTIGERLHRYIWKHYNGEIPEGYHIHHKDGDKDNNILDNLELISYGSHSRKHGKERAFKDTEWLEKFNKRGIENAKKWHASEEGRKWHSKHAKRLWKNRKPKTKTCEVCGDKYKTKSLSGNERFCSNACKAKWRRDSGVDDEVRKCAYCEKEFTVNKYSKQECCSKSCSNRLKPRLPQLRKD